MEALGPLVGENLGVKRVPMEVREDGLQHSLRIGDAVDVEIEDVVPFGVETGEPARLTGIFHPAGSRADDLEGDALEDQRVRHRVRGQAGFSPRSSPGRPERRGYAASSTGDGRGDSAGPQPRGRGSASIALLLALAARRLVVDRRRMDGMDAGPGTDPARSACTSASGW